MVQFCFVCLFGFFDRMLMTCTWHISTTQTWTGELLISTNDKMAPSSGNSEHLPWSPPDIIWPLRGGWVDTPSGGVLGRVHAAGAAEPTAAIGRVVGVAGHIVSLRVTVTIITITGCWTTGRSKRNHAKFELSYPHRHTKCAQSQWRFQGLKLTGLTVITGMGYCSPIHIMWLTHYRHVPGILGLGSMGNVCCRKFKLSSTG